MLKKLINWLFFKEEPESKEVKVFDFVNNQSQGHDITLRVFDDGEYAEGVIFLSLSYDPPEVGDFVVVSLYDETMTFVIEKVEYISLTASKVSLNIYHGAEDEE